MASKGGFDDLDLSKDEVKRIAEALKKEEFRKLLVEYAKEISDPENKKRYEDEIRQMENERGMDIKFINPDPGYVVKTTVNGKTKAFINVCKSDIIGKPSSQKQVSPDGTKGLSWNLPHSFSPPREDVDVKGDRCQVYDFVIHPDTYRMAESNVRFKNMVHDTAFDGIEKQFAVKLDRKNHKVPKIKFKGTPTPTVMRTRQDGDNSNTNGEKKELDDIMGKLPYPYDDTTSAEKAKKREEEINDTIRKEKLKQNKQCRPSSVTEVTGKNGMKEDDIEDFAEPAYAIVHRTEHDFQNYTNIPDAKINMRPKELIISIDLPMLKSATQVALDIFEKRLLLQSDNPAKYKLDITLPYPVNENDGTAKFDKSKKKLIVTLPVVPLALPGSQDSGVSNSDLTVHNGIKEDKVSLIEEIPTKDDEKKCLHETRKACVEDLSKVTEMAAGRSLHLDYTLPDYAYHQEDNTVSFILHAGKVIESTIKLTFIPTLNGCHLTMMSMGSGGFPIHYSICIQFSQDYRLEDSNCSTSVSTENVVLMLVKDEACLGMWENFFIGINEMKLEEKLFVTRGALQHQLERLDASMPDTVPDTAPDTAASPDLQVLNLNDERMTVHIQDKIPKRKKRISESADDIELVFDKTAPAVRSILRQGSRTVSESSDDVLSASYGRQNSESSPPGSDDGSTTPTSGGSVGGRRKTVSFSEYVDRTMYKSGQAVSTMRSTLKSKRRRMRKKEQRSLEKEDKKERRRQRRLSSGSDHSGDEQASGGGGGGGAEGDTRGGDEGQRERTREAAARRSDSYSGADNEEEESDDGDDAPEDAGVVGSPRGGDAATGGLGLGDDEAFAKETKAGSEGKSTDVTPSKKTNSKPKSKSSKKERSKKGYRTSGGGGGGGKDTVSDAGESVPNSNAKESGSGQPESLIQKASGNQNGDRRDRHNVNGDGESAPDSGEQKEADAQEVNVEQKVTRDPDAPETMLSWAEGQAPSGEHKTTCAVDFSNSVMYDLDVE